MATIAGREVPAGRLGMLREAGPKSEWRARLAEDGYLLLRGAIDRDDVLAARAEVLAALRSVGEVEGDDAHPVATGASRRAALHGDLGAFWRAVCEGWALRAAVHGPAMRGVAAAALGAACVPFDFVWLRAMTAGRASRFHFDHAFMNRGTDQVLTAWVPLGEVRVEDGPIAVAEGSLGWTDLADRVRGRDVDRDPGFTGSFLEDVVELVEAREARVLTAEFAPGDVLLFGMFLFHGSLDNAASGKVRLSADTRFQLADAPRDDRWFGAPPAGHGGGSYGGLSGAQPLTADPIVR
jgi:ectoine hydroxylase-related dioxygenase (phytanoyl-CoA dioxygenase family)